MSSSLREGQELIASQILKDQRWSIHGMSIISVGFKGAGLITYK
jgi:hypothetical protein